MRMDREAIEAILSDNRDDEFGCDATVEMLALAALEREGLLGECLLRFRLALTSIFVGNGPPDGEAEHIVAAAIALLVEHDAVDPSEPEGGQDA